MSGIFLVAAKRTPFGAFGGSLKGLSATDLGVISTQAALASAKLDPEAVDSVFFGNVIQSSSDAAYLARHVGLRSGMKQSTPALTINRLCGSGFESVILGAQSIQVGECHISVCGGAENMSDAPLTLRGNDARWGVKFGTGLKLGDALWDGLTDSYTGTPMGITAENLAKKYNISREVRTYDYDWNKMLNKTLETKRNQEYSQRFFLCFACLLAISNIYIYL
jgi:acetyl-CoA acyltransferase 2